MISVFFDSYGEIKFIYEGSSLALQVQANIDLDFIVTNDSVDLIKNWISDVLNPSIDLLPTAPSAYHRFDFELREWVLFDQALEQAKLSVYAKIMAFGDNLHNLQIAYAGLLLDADSVARENINGKVNQLKSEIDLGLSSTDLFWKDADNVVHSWASSTVYLVWLQGLVIAIASRRTSLYALTWQAKSDVSAMTDVNDVLAFDVSAAFI